MAAKGIGTSAKQSPYCGSNHISLALNCFLAPHEMQLFRKGSYDFSAPVSSGLAAVLSQIDMLLELQVREFVKTDKIILTEIQKQ